MDRREVVNNPDEYDTPGEWGPPTGADTAQGGAVPGSGAALRLRYGGMRGASGQPGADPWSLPRPNAATIPRAEAPQVRTPAKPARFTGAGTANRLMCLYLGPAGERCDEPARDNGFCPRHQPNASPSASPTAPRDESRARKKKAAATVGIIAAMWPIVEQILRAIFHLFR